MNIFLIGLPNSGRTTVARALSEDGRRLYIDAASWVKATFRERQPGEHLQHYLDEYHAFLTKRLNANPFFVMDNVYDLMKSFESENKSYVIDGLLSPKDFAHLFDYRNDIVVFLNRTDNEREMRDQETIGVTCIRDYCVWLASAGLLPRNRWVEYNFKIPGEHSDHVKMLGAKNSVYIVRSIEKAISHLKDHLKSLESS